MESLWQDDLHCKFCWLFLQKSARENKSCIEFDVGQVSNIYLRNLFNWCLNPSLNYTHNPFDWFDLPGDEDVYHFVAYVPSDGTVYELDGLQSGPIPVGTYSSPPTSWLNVAREAIQDRMNASPEIKFNLMAVIQDQRIELKKRLAGLENDNDKAAEHSDVVASLAAQDEKRKRWELENQRRRHNYVPLCMEIIKGLARVGTLQELVTEAKERYAEKLQKKKMKASS